MVAAATFGQARTSAVGGTAQQAGAGGPVRRCSRIIGKRRAMMKAAWISRWSGVIPGREALALETFMESADFWDKRIADGQVESRQAYVSPAGHGMIIVTGERASLSAVLEMPEYLRFMAKTDLCAAGLEGELMATGESATQLVGTWAEVAKEHGYL
jgi:hypothetical protein